MSKNKVPRNERSQLQEHAEQKKQQEKQPRKPDQRIRRTCERLGSALVALIQEKPVDDVTVQEVLDRASVGRSTFYLHYSDKDDLLLSQLEKFLETMSTALSIRKEESHRVVPVAELFAHIGDQKKLYRALADSGRLNDFFDLAQGYFARAIEQRLTESKRLSKLPQRELSARASALAGSMLSLLRWWLDRGAKESPHALDELFHRMVWNGLQ
jgi:AcrR family transcriptional regulator